MIEHAAHGNSSHTEEKWKGMKKLFLSQSVGRNGVSYVLKPSDQYEVLAVNTLDDKFDCSPAFVGDEMFLKGKQNLYCIAASQ